MNTDEKNRMDAEQEFKDAVFKVFSERIPGAYKDEDGFIVIPKRKPRKRENRRK